MTDTEAYLQYYLTIDGQTTLITESSEVRDGQISTNVSSVKVDEAGNIDSSTRKTQHLTSSIADKMLMPEIGLRSSATSECNWKPYSTTYSLAGAHFTVLSVSMLLLAATGMGLPAATTVAIGLIDLLIAEGKSYIPDSIYFEGERCVSKSVGKMYYRYRGNIYLDSSKSKLLLENASWSKRWGH